MVFKHLRILTCFVLLLWISYGISQSPVEFNVTPKPKVNLIIKPHICIAPRGENSCISRIDLFWESNINTDLCLHGGITSEVLQCWEQRNSGMFQHHVTLLKDINYWLASFNQQKILAESSVKFAALKPHRKQLRRRNKLPWSIQSL